MVVVLFLYALLQVRLCTEAAARSSRITGLKAELKKIETDLDVAQSRLNSRQVYGAIMAPAEAGGFGPGGEHRVIATLAPAPVPGNRLLSQVGVELSAGVRMLLPQALAQEFRAGTPKQRASHP
jgi:hypothetical protein